MKNRPGESGGLRVTLASEVAARIRKACRSAWPHEASGLLLVAASGFESDSIFVGDCSVAPLERDDSGLGRDQFVIEANHYLETQRRGRASGRNLEIAGHFHAHPGASATPSASDREFSEGISTFGSTWIELIVGMRSPDALSLRAWLFRDGSYEELRLDEEP